MAHSPDEVITVSCLLNTNKEMRNVKLSYEEQKQKYEDRKEIMRKQTLKHIWFSARSRVRKGELALSLKYRCWLGNDVT